MTGTSRALRSSRPEGRAALGFRTHSGWAAAIVLTGTPKNPRIALRRRIELCDPSIEGSKQPFHHAEPMPFPKAKDFIARCAKSTDALARSSVAALVTASDGAAPGGACILAAAGRPLPDLRAILASHALIHTAEGEFYRDALARACGELNVKAGRLGERDAASWTASRLGIPEGELKARLVEMGRALGPPWTADEKLATMGAWLVLAG
ncbi:MAG TPA: hypothetical protein VMH86_08735 [Rhizomicrobium sp.]|nr:hypothetical protein [Rhizomicrobium sp.]